MIIPLRIRGRGWLITLLKFGGVVIILSPRFLVQFVGWNSCFKPPDWIKWRVM